jgi:hypothetical protein
MLRNKRLWPGLLILFSLYRINAQEAVQELITDRPDQTESSSVLPHKSLQIETGFVAEIKKTGQSTQTGYVYNTTLMRYGLLENMELRLGLAYISEKEKFSNIDSVSSLKGFTPLYTGLKLQITREKGFLPEIALLAALVLPFSTTEKARPDYTGINMRLSLSHTLSDLFSLGYNLGAEWYGETPVPSYYYSVALGFEISGKAGSYIEIFGFVPETGTATHLIDGGFTFLLLPNLQLDTSGGIGLNEAATDYFISFGLSYRMPH